MGYEIHVLRAWSEAFGSAWKMLLKSRWRSHESGVMPRPLVVDSLIQAISLLCRRLPNGFNRSIGVWVVSHRTALEIAQASSSRAEP